MNVTGKRKFNTQLLKIKVRIF